MVWFSDAQMAVPTWTAGVNTAGRSKRLAIDRAGLDAELTPHACRHTWASWHYTLNRDLLALKVVGGWSSVALVERYAHLMPAGHAEAIKRFLGDPWVTDTTSARATN
jgi:integrase